MYSLYIVRIEKVMIRSTFPVKPATITFGFFFETDMCSFCLFTETIMSDSCAICTDKYTTVRKPVECPQCKHSACARCVKTFLVQNTVEPKCMACPAPWDMDFVRRNLSKNFMDGEYKKHQVSTLLHRAESSVGDLQPLVPVKTRIEALQQEIREETLRARTMDNKRGARNRIRTLQEEKWTLDYEWLHGAPTVQVHAGSVADSATKSIFFMACPRKDCRGRVSSGYKCGLCEHFVCPDCHVDKGLEQHGPHECSVEDKDTVKLLKENTKKCPECHEGIFKESGCDQMWCTRCRTCFSWKTGKKEHGPIHNPHYYEQMFQNGGEGVAPVGAPVVAGHGHFANLHVARYNLLVQRWTVFFSVENQAFLRSMHDLMQHLRYVELPRLQETIQYHEARDHQKWGVDYLRNKISRNTWGQKLYLAYRKTQRAHGMHAILERVVVGTGHLFQDWFRGEMGHPELVFLLKELFDDANKNIGLFNKRFGTHAPYVDLERGMAHYVVYQG